MPEPTITATAVPYLFSAYRTTDKIAKPSSYISITLEYRGRASASVELPLIEKTAWYGSATVKPNCPAAAYASPLCWQSSDLRVEVGVYLLSTWRVGETVTVKPRVTQVTGEVVEIPLSWVIGGGTPTMAPVWTATPTRTPGVSVQWRPGWTWIMATGSGPELLFTVTTGAAMAPRSKLTFCDADHSCCTWLANDTDDPTWGQMLVRAPTGPGCAEMRWVWAEHPVSVSGVRWTGTW